MNVCRFSSIPREYCTFSVNVYEQNGTVKIYSRRGTRKMPFNVLIAERNNQI